jgi:malate dehydrogenase (oxaloacetate-decarboxylating)
MLSNADTSVIFRLKLTHKNDIFPKVTMAIADSGARIGAVDIIRVESDGVIRDITVYTGNQGQLENIRESLNHIDGVEVINESDRTFLMHLGGKIEVKGKIDISNRDQLSMAYTPGVARVCMAIHEAPEKAHNLTMKRNMVAVVTDGSAVLGLGNIGPEAALPVMEGKAMLFKSFADVDAFPICLKSQDIDTVVETVKQISPGFGGINLEDFAAPQCFEIEDRLKKALDIPVFHDDQHGTAIVFCAGLINALKIIKKNPTDLKVIVNGVGAAGTACTKIMKVLGVKNIIGFDRKGVLTRSRNDLSPSKQAYVDITNPYHFTGTLSEAMRDADVFVGLSSPNVISVEDIKAMNKDPIVFVMANPTPEIMPEIAAPHVAIIATGRSDYPNQVNNLLAFPGIFRGALDCHASDINEAMKIAAANAIANVIEEKDLSPDYIIPSVFDPKVAKAVAEAVIAAARESGVARK